MHSFHVFSRVVGDRVFVGVGELRIPQDCRSLASFKSLQEALKFRDRRRAEIAFGVFDAPNHHPKARNASAGF